ncbi:MAG: VOC family protein [Gammaproteobacteria bacterium]|nr:VOC family protein [Gammaproteobacteria bacterium]
MQKMTLCLWFDNQAEEAAKHYAAIFKHSEIGTISRYGKEGFEFHGKPAGTAMVVNFKLNGMDFIALNGGPKFQFNEAASIVVNCETQAEIDYFWASLSEGGEEGPCGWLKDKYGVSWQIVPTILPAMLCGSDTKKSQSVTKVFLKMKKFDIAALQHAYEAA